MNFKFIEMLTHLKTPFLSTCIEVNIIQGEKFKYKSHRGLFTSGEKNRKGILSHKNLYTSGKKSQRCSVGGWTTCPQDKILIGIVCY